MAILAPCHVFPEPGAHTVNLVVEDEDGASDEAWADVIVTMPLDLVFTDFEAVVTDRDAHIAFDVENMGMQRMPVHAYAPKSEAARSFHELWLELLNRLDANSSKV